MEKKLADYRKKKEREQYYNDLKAKFTNLFRRRVTKDVKMEQEQPREPLIKEPLTKDDLNSTAGSDVQSDISESPEWQCDNLDFIYYFLITAIWITLWIIFIKLEFGAVYFVISGFVIIYFNTRTGKKKENEVSAYSVFNKNCESIDGTIKAEDLERQMVYGRII